MHLATKAVEELEERYSFYDEARRIYEEMGSVEALVAQAMQDDDLCEWLLTKGAGAVVQELRARDRHRALEVVSTPNTAVVDVSPLRREAQARGVEAAKAKNRTRRLQHAIFDWPLYDGTRLGDASIEKLETQQEYHRRIVQGNQRMYEAFEILIMTLRKSGKKKLSEAIDGNEAASLIGRPRALRG